MPPRRSTRNSLPTPAQSSRAESISSTPRAAFDKDTVPSGMLTPASLTDGSEGSVESCIMVDEGVMVKAEVDVEVGDSKVATATGLKRKAEDDASPFSLSPPATSTGSVSGSRYQIDSITVPARRSKLSTEKTTSADNLTLGSPSSKLKREIRSFVDTKPSDIMEDDLDIIVRKGKAKGKAKVDTSKEGQPFNVGTFSSVSKADARDLALESDDSALSDEHEAGKKKAAGKAKAKPAAKKSRAKAKQSTIADEESEFEMKDEDYFAMNSEEEEEQLKKAVQASIGAEKSSATSSRASSASVRGKGRGRGRGKTAGQAVGGRANNSKALRTAVARAAEKRAAAAHDAKAASDSDSTGSEYSPMPTGTSTRPTTSAAASGSATPLDFADYSEEESELSDFSGSETDDSDIGVRKKSGGKKRGWGAGRRLDNGNIELGEMDPGLLDDMDVETRSTTLASMRAKRRAEKDRENELNKPIKAREKQLKKELGRRLTNGEKNLIRLQHHHAELHDVWGDLASTIKPVKPVAMEAHPSLKLTLLPFQKESLYWMKKQEEGPWKGGMLADEMGMGKTIQTIALLLSEPRRKPSLVVAPVVALMQWKHEIETHAEGFKVCLWHGQQRMKAAELKKYDVVLSSYGTLEAAFRRQQRGFKRGDVFIKEKSPMHTFQWFRVVLDEAHNIKERSTNAAKAAFALDAEYKWCLSGTPLQNRVGELYSLVRFLGADPFSHYFCKKCDCKSLHWQFKDKRHCDQCGHTPMNHVCFWNTEILTPIARYGIEQGNPGHTAFKKLKILLDRMMLRRTKLERADDLGLPPRTIVVRRDYFSPAEKELYKSLFSDAKRTFSTYVDAGTVLNNYSNIFSLITRMRQMACHPDLVLRSKNSVLVKDQAEASVCRLCNDQAEDAIMSQCKHVFDRECIRQYLEVQQNRGHKPECPVCHIEISIDLEAEAIDLEAYAGKSTKAKQGILSRLNLDNWRSSSKLEALVEELEKLRNKDCTIKSLVFSQFVSFLDLIAFRLQRAGFNICRLEGGMTPQQRDATIQHFMKNSEVTVFLISLKAGGVALNLTEASMVFMMDSWWNPSVEYQAMDRIHRLGQKRPVKVVKLVVADSIEQQIVELQAKKLAMTEAALSTDPDAALGKLTIEDLGFLFKM